MWDYCGLCGAVIGFADIHDQWHEAQNDAIEAVVSAVESVTAPQPNVPEEI